MRRDPDSQARANRARANQVQINRQQVRCSAWIAQISGRLVRTSVIIANPVSLVNLAKAAVNRPVKVVSPAVKAAKAVSLAVKAANLAAMGSSSAQAATGIRGANPADPVKVVRSRQDKGKVQAPSRPAADNTASLNSSNNNGVRTANALTSAPTSARTASAKTCEQPIPAQTPICGLNSALPAKLLLPHEHQLNLLPHGIVPNPSR